MKYNAFADECGCSIEEQISAIIRNNLNGIEIRYIDNENITHINKSKIKKCSELLKAENIKIWAIASPIGKITLDSDFNNQIELLKHCIEISHVLETKYIRIFSFYTINEKSISWNSEQVLIRLQSLMDIARDNNIVLCLENEKGTYGYNASNCLSIFKTIPNLRGVFDPANYIACGQDVLEAWNLLKNYIEYLHIKDALKDGTIVLPGQGIGHLSYIFNEYKNMGGRAVTIEPHLKKLSFFDDLERKEKSKIITSDLNSQDLFQRACEAFFRNVCEM